MVKSRKFLSKKHYKKSRKSRNSHKHSTKKHRKLHKKKMSRRIHRGGNPLIPSSSSLQNGVKEQWNKSTASLHSAMQKHVPDDLLLKAKHSAKNAEIASKEVIDHITNAARHYGNHILNRGKKIMTKIQTYK